MLLIAIRLLKRRWRLIGATTLITIVASVALAIFMTPIYRGEILVTYVTSDESASGLSALAGRLTGLPLLGGLNLGESGDTRSEAVATLESRQFSEAFIRKHDLLPVLFPGLWDATAKRWTVTGDEIPSMADGFKRFNEDIRSISDDRTTGLIRIAISSQERLKVAAWTNDLIVEADKVLRERALREARASVAFLERELTRTNLMETKQVIYQLMEAQLGKAAMANSRDFFAFRIIDPAVTPEPDEQVRPKRVLLVVLGVLMGFFLGFAIALLQESMQAATDA